SLYHRRRVALGDVMYIISQHSGRLLLGGRMIVGKIVSREEAVRICRNTDLYDAPQWVIGKKGSGTAFHTDRQLAPDVSKQLRFVTGMSGDRKPLHFVNDTQIERQSFRGLRQLEPQSAYLLDAIIDMTAGPHCTGQPITVFESSDELSISGVYHEGAL